VRPEAQEEPKGQSLKRSVILLYGNPSFLSREEHEGRVVQDREIQSQGRRGQSERQHLRNLGGEREEMRRVLLCILFMVPDDLFGAEPRRWGRGGTTY
jgi:hypothetical protein